jgi:hypothetical protein
VQASFFVDHDPRGGLHFIRYRSMYGVDLGLGKGLACLGVGEAGVGDQSVAIDFRPTLLLAGRAKQVGEAQG